MSYHHQPSGSSRSNDGRRRPINGNGRGSSSWSREPPQKRLKSDQVDPASASDRASSSKSSDAHTLTRDDQQDVASNLDSWLDEYDAGIDHEEKRRRALDESRKRRKAIMDKYGSSQPPTLLDTAAQPIPPAASKEVSSVPPLKASDAAISSATPSTNGQESFTLVKSSNQEAHGAHDDADAHPTSAAELDPDADRAQELARLEQRRQSKLEQQRKQANQQEQEYEEIEVTDEEDDAEMDMFALSDDDDGDKASKKKKTKIIRAPKNKSGGSTAILPTHTTALPLTDAASAKNLSSNWDDTDGYLRVILGETLDERYQIFAMLGKGMFASVVRARDLRDNGREVAIKIIRVQESMYKAGLKEVGILRKLNDADPDDRKHVVRLERHFDYKGHLCMVFESLGMNLREVVRRYGRDVGLNMQAVRAYAHQLFLALSHLAKNAILHADIKPDNVLVNDTKTLLKLCDLGSASSLSEMEITPYLVSRFYRAPEIILGQAYDCSIDVWSIGCTLYELATGKILFAGRTNNHMLLLMQEVRGRFTAKQIRKSQFGEQHFDDANAFLSMEPDKNTGQSVVRRVMLHKPTLDLRSRLLPTEAAKQLKADELKMMNHFVDLLERCLELDPAKRIKPKDALEHAFVAHVSK
ncbi:related to mRNA splicing-associated serine-threonine protein kinase [Sporisorium reilianum f. sp. reilianum]|uniref:non-specific serine/threonine protein kinase n=1 Tax=Sporisorium reilianum f. sp. reilianum TaxID=72559 RepID=A0A2N8UBR0_9BASI|nr:related to mRNA splicing-associated serine-threonine protein kinase [Sporisorium reilianum f. sp. reilianum]